MIMNLIYKCFDIFETPDLIKHASLTYKIWRQRLQSFLFG